MSTVEEALDRVPLFGGLKKRDRKGLAQTMVERTFPAGSTVTDVGKGGIGFFVIDGGSATVKVGGKARRTLKSGDYFGEIALIDGGLRSAQIIADSDLHCFGMTSWEFRPFVEEHPDVAWALLKTLASRVREAESRED